MRLYVASLPDYRATHPDVKRCCFHSLGRIFLFLRGGAVEEQLTAGIEYIHVLECLELM